MKIYIIGPCGTGKTTLAKRLSTKYNVKYYELDKLVHDDDNGHIKRSDKEIARLFNKILNKKSWIIEDVGISKFTKGREAADKIYYLKIPKKVACQRVITRWLKQRLGKEHYNYPPTFHELIYLLKVTINYYKNENKRLETLNDYKDKLTYLDIKEIEKL